MDRSRLRLWIEGIAHDARYAVRTLRRQPRFVFAASLTLALGMSASVTIFSIARGVLLHAVDVTRVEKLFYIYSTYGARDRRNFMFPWEALWLHGQVHSFAPAARTMTDRAVVTGAGDPFRADIAWVSGEFFQVLQVPPEIGRNIGAEDDLAGAEPVVVLAYHAWRTRFGQDPHIVGRRVELEGKTYRIIGVAGRQLSTLRQRRTNTEFWIPAAQSDSRTPFILIGRLRPGITIEAANAELAALGARQARIFPDREGFSFEAAPVAEFVLGDIPKHLRAFAFATGTLLLIACLNVSGLLLSRTTGRRAEVSLHIVLGAGRFRILRFVFFEALSLSLLGTALGLCLAVVFLKTITLLGSTVLPGADRIVLDSSAVLIALGIAVSAAVLTSVVPAAIATGAAANDLHSARRGSTDSGLRRAGGLIITLQFAAGLILLTGSGILLNNLIRLLKTPVDFNPDTLLAMEIPNAPSLARQDWTFSDEVLRHVRSVPGVREVALAQPGVTGAGIHVRLDVPGRPAARARRVLIPTTNVSPTFFHLMSIPVLAGRDFTQADARSPEPPVIINDALARYVWPDQSAIGMGLTMPGGAGAKDRYLAQVIGVVRTAPIYGAHYGTSKWQIYLPVEPGSGMQVLMRTSRAAEELAPVLRKIVHDMAPRQPIGSIATLRDLISEEIVPDRFYTYLLLSFTILSITIAASGLHGLLQYVIASRRHEIGVRIAIGARAQHLMMLLFGFGLRAALSGTAMGIAGAYATTGVLRSLLYGVKPNNPLTFALAALIMVAVTLLACIGKLWRSTALQAACFHGIPFQTVRAVFRHTA